MPLAFTQEDFLVLFMKLNIEQKLLMWHIRPAVQSKLYIHDCRNICMCIFFCVASRDCFTIAFVSYIILSSK